MPLLPDDGRRLHRALTLAREAHAFASPNPAVGCVLTHGEQTLGEGAHQYEQRDHAEIVALKAATAAGHDVRGATAFVTLEPCSHHGRTGPCSDALIAAGIARCVVATVDPNPRVRGEGLRRLSAAGIEVVVAEPSSTVGNAARRLNDAFAFSIQNAQPFITLKAAISAEGRLAPPPTARREIAPHWLTGSAARADVQELRHASDVVLTGSGTVLADDPELTDRTGQPRRRPLLRVVLDSELRTPLHSKLVHSVAGDLLLIASPRAPEERRAALTARGVEVVTLPDTSDPSAFTALFAGLLHSRGVLSVLVEAGSRLNGSLLESGFVDRLILYRSPMKLGPGALPFAATQPGPEVWEQRLTAVTRTAFPHGSGPHSSGEDLRVCGYFHDPWEGVGTRHAPILQMPSRT